LSLEQPLFAGGRVGFLRGVSDSTTLIGFFHATNSVRTNEAQNSATPENFVGVAIEGPSSDGFFFYPTYGVDQEGVRAGGGRGTPAPPAIHPDGKPHDWTLTYHPDANTEDGRVTVTLDGQVVTLDLDPGHRGIGAQFNRFGIITTHIDGNGQTVYFDDLTYSIARGAPELVITRPGAGEVLLQWPNSFPEFVLERGLDLETGGAWTPFTGQIVRDGGFLRASVTPVHVAEFFRLAKP
jgi:hypothetical protein